MDEGSTAPSEGANAATHRVRELELRRPPVLAREVAAALPQLELPVELLAPPPVDGGAAATRVLVHRLVELRADRLLAIAVERVGVEDGSLLGHLPHLAVLGELMKEVLGVVRVEARARREEEADVVGFGLVLA